jgi:hypothetical protein
VRLAILINVVGIGLTIAAVWQGLNQRILAAILLTVCAVAVALIREKF